VCLLEMIGVRADGAKELTPSMTGTGHPTTSHNHTHVRCGIPHRHAPLDHPHVCL